MDTDDYAEWRTHRQESNQQRFARDIETLAHSRLSYDVRGNHHYIVQSPNGAFDYWPSTGKWHKREKDAPYRNGGIEPLLSACGFDSDAIAALRAGGVVPIPTNPTQTAIEALNAYVDTHTPLLIQHAPHMSKFAVWAYEQAGFVVMGKPS